MNRGLISAFLIPVLLLYTVFSGCFNPPKRIEKVLPDEPNLVNERIAGVVTRAGEKITFDNHGGSYRRAFSLTGETVDGQKITLTSSSVAEFRLTVPDTSSWAKLGNQRVTEVVTRDGRLVEFVNRGGILNQVAEVILGKTSTGVDVSFSELDIRQIRTSRPKNATPSQLLSDTSLKVIEVVTNDGFLYTLKSNGYALLAQEEALEGVNAQTHQFVQLPLQDILYVQVERVDSFGRALAVFLSVILVTALVAGIVVLIILATKQSCPFVYSYDGTRYVFDAEPLGGATTKSLLRTDYSKLKHLRPVNGTYRLLVRNEVDETQYLDHMSLVEIDHDSSVQIVADQWGTFHGVRNLYPVLAANDEHGASILPFVVGQDSIFWQTDMESELLKPDPQKRHTLTFSFAKPCGAQRATLVFHGGTTAWGSNMIREMYKLYGNTVNEYHNALDEKRPEFYRMLQFMDREELYEMKIYLKNDTGWTQRGTIRGGGPFIYETQIIPLSVRHVASDTVTIQVRPPAGFWAIDYVGIQYDAEETYVPKEIQPASAINQNGDNILPKLSVEDGTFTIMPTTNDRFTIEFPVSPEPVQQARTLFLKTTGYYVLNFHPDGPPVSDVLERIGTTPGAIVEYSYQLFHQWKTSIANR